MPRLFNPPPVEERRRFKLMFKRDLMSFWDFFGFDVVKFDKWIAPVEGQSTAEAVEDKYGKDAVQFALLLIGAPERPKKKKSIIL